MSGKRVWKGQLFKAKQSLFLFFKEREAAAEPVPCLRGINPPPLPGLVSLEKNEGGGERKWIKA